ncbi:MAG: NAD-dependent epimerase/dehydratase family protein [Bacteroidota bacterium]|nr:NAD-dependent epimerase/dehydratase family protein [Candidatus Kapabacteria bacterium]MDW8219372.1 NAD-dependent epimerase/dehydratase family protein [Bacteroidota bacterium]
MRRNGYTSKLRAIPWVLCIFQDWDFHLIEKELLTPALSGKFALPFTPITIHLMNTALILGGAGFIGSALAARFSREGWQVIVIDGMLKRTGARRENVVGLRNVTLIEQAVEHLTTLDDYLAASDIIIDSMAWTAHRSALYEPEFDMRCNQHSHLCVATALARHSGKRLIYLSSRGVYGNPTSGEITEETPLLPEDIQGVHKLAAESYYRIYAKLYRYAVVSLRFGNCFGEHMPTQGEDIGLIGGFIRDILEGRAIEVFGTHRTRPIIYVHDIAEYVWRLTTCHDFRLAFDAYNANGQMISIHKLAQHIVDTCGTGQLVVKPLPHELQAIDIGSTPINCNKIQSLTGFSPSQILDEPLQRTVQYFRTRLTSTHSRP